MSRTLDARLSKMELEIGGTEGDRQSYENLLCSIRRRLLEMIENPNTTPAVCADARENLSHLDAGVWNFYGEQRRMHIIDALREGRLSRRVAIRVVNPKKGDSEGPDWDEVAKGLGLPVAPYAGLPLLISHLIVSPPDHLETMQLPRLGNGTAAD